MFTKMINNLTGSISKTVLFYTILGIVGLSSIIAGAFDGFNFIFYAGIVIVGISAVGLFLRSVTTEPLSKKGIAKSKTVMFNTALGLVGSIEAYSGSLSGMFGTEEAFGGFMVVIGMIGFILRSVTVKPLNWNNDEA